MSKWVKRKPIIQYHENDSILDKLLKIRGVENKEQFLNPGKDVLHDPYLLTNINLVTNRITKAIKDGQKIVLSVDPDVDGITNVCFLYRYLKNFTNNIYYTYHQRDKGHGVNNQMDQVTDDTSVLIILDSSTNSVEECRELFMKGIDTLVVDHHPKTVDNPYVTLLNPQTDGYPNKSISTVGLVYKVCQVLDKKLNVSYSDDFLDLTSTGLQADMMDCRVLDNRYMMIQGMKNIKNPGIKTILKQEKVKLNKVNSTEIGFKVSALINGCARMDQIELPIKLLLEDDEKECVKIYKKMKEVNEKKKEIQNELTIKYKNKINENEKIIIITDPEARSGFNGLIANTLSQEFKRPVFILKDDGKELKGSGRSYGEFDTNEFFNQSGLANAAGHKNAHGLMVGKDKLNDLKNYINNNISDNQFDTSIKYDLELNADEIAFDLIREINKFNYLTGQGFPKAKFKINGLMIDDDVATLGKNKDTKKIVSGYIELMKFKTDEDYADDLSVFDEINVIGELSINEWFNWKQKRTIKKRQVILNDYRITG